MGDSPLTPSRVHEIPALAAVSQVRDEIFPPHEHGSSSSLERAEKEANEKLDELLGKTEEKTAQNAHAVGVAKVVELLETDLVQGLKAAEAEARLEKYGPNKLAEAKPPTLLYRIYLQLNQMLVKILIVAGVVSGALQNWPVFGLIVGVVVINTVIGLLQEGKASAATAALKSMLSTKATVIRDGVRVEIDAQNVVPGDIVFVESGNKVPADIRLFEVSNLGVQEAMLTGESLPVKKHVNICGLNISLGDRKNMGYSATLVIKGQGSGIVVATGDATQIGQINELVSEVVETKTHLMKQVDKFGRFIGFLVAPITLATFLIALFTEGGSSLGGSSTNATGVTGEKAQNAFVISVAIAVSMIPAGLPAIMTITMAIAVSFMAKNNAIVKALPSVETLGAVNVICSDKTGTLTKNEMTVVAVRTRAILYNVSGVGYDPSLGTVNPSPDAPQQITPEQDAGFLALVRGGILNNESRLERATLRGHAMVLPIGDPSECALCCLGEKSKHNLDDIRATYRRVGVIPFESEHKFMATFHEDPKDKSKVIAFIKGAPDRLSLKSSKQINAAGEEEPMNFEFWKEEVQALSGRGLRCLAICQATLQKEEVEAIITKGPAYISESPDAFLTFLGLVAILDPPREECIVAIKQAHISGIRVCMITGDHPATAKSIGAVLGLVDDAHQRVITGPEMDKMTPEELKKAVLECNIFARSSPDNKINIVRAMQSNGLCASMTGDGVNDAPALRAADIGVAMGITGSDVSKDAAKIILTDDNFATILVAVKEGRRVWDNLRKIIIYNMCSNMAQGGIIFFALCLQWNVIPLTAIQVLYINLITACSLGLILAYEPAESDVMERPPRRAGKGLIGKLFIWRTVYVSGMFIFFTLGAVAWIRDMDPIKYDGNAQRSIAFNCLIFCEISFAFSCRFIKLSSFHPRVFYGNYLAWVCAFIMAGINIMVTYVPGLNGFFSMSPMDGTQWGIVILFMVLSFIVVETEKALTDPLKPYTQPIVKAFQEAFARLPGCPKCSCGLDSCMADVGPKDKAPIPRKDRTGGFFRYLNPSSMAKSYKSKTNALNESSKEMQKDPLLAHAQQNV